MFVGVVSLLSFSLCVFHPLYHRQMTVNGGIRVTYVLMGRRPE